MGDRTLIHSLVVTAALMRGLIFAGIPERMNIMKKTPLLLLSLSVHERHKAKTLWEKTGAVIMVVRRPG